MPQGHGQVVEIWEDEQIGNLAWMRGTLAGRVSLPPKLMPVPGQYLLAWPAVDPEVPLPSIVFPGGCRSGPGLEAAPPLPASWYPGLPLALRGPLGAGFRLPASTRRLALAAIEGSPARLLPLLAPVLAQPEGAAILFYDPDPSAAALPEGLPAAVEVLPLSELNQALAWADFLALDMPLSALPSLRSRLNLLPQQRLALPAQALLNVPMPCGGAAECGVCAVPTRAGWKLACREGPVFPLGDLEW
jgi:hypothetical protein